MTPRNSSRRVAILLLLVFLGAFALRLYRLGYQGIWYDEAVSIHLATKDLLGLTQHTAGDIHPPLYYYLLHFWAQAAGTSEFSAAFLSLVFGIVIIAGCYRLGTALFGRGIGLLAAFLVAVSPFNLWYSQEIRMYTLGAFLGLVSLYTLVRLAGLTEGDRHTQSGDLEGLSAGRSRTWKLWVGYVLSAAAGLYTLYYFAFLLIFENLFVLGWWLASRNARGDRPVSLGRWLLAQVMVVLLYLPWLPVALRQAMDPPVPPWRSFTGLGSVLLESWTALSLGQSVNPESLLIWPVLSLIFALYLLGVIGGARAPRGALKSALLCGYTFVPLFLIYVLSLRIPLFHVRYVFTYSPTFYVLLAVGLRQLSRGARWALPIGLAVITLWSGYSAYSLHSAPQYVADDHRGAVSYIEKRIAPGDAVLINAGYAYPAFLYYYEGQIAWQGRLVDYGADSRREGVPVLQTGSIGGDQGLGWGDPHSDFYATSEEETVGALERIFASHDRVWVYRIYDTVTDPDGFIRQWLEEYGRLLGEAEFAGESYLRVQCYLTAGEPEYDAVPKDHSLDLEVVDGLKLGGFSAPPTVRAGEQLSVTLQWQRDEEEAEYTVQLGLASEGTGPDDWIEVAASRMSILGEMQESQELLLEIPPGTPPLDYTLLIHLYDASAGGDSAPLTPGWEIGAIRVVKPLVPAPTPAMPHEPWANFGDLLQLTGYSVKALESEPGSEIELELFWRAWGVPLPLIRTEIAWRDGDGTDVGTETACLVARYPSTLWGREELVHDLCRVEVPEVLSPGSYELTLRLEVLRLTGRWQAIRFWSTAGWEETFKLGTVSVVGP